MTRFEQREGRGSNSKEERNVLTEAGKLAAKLGLTAALMMGTASGLSGCGESAAAETNNQTTSEQSVDNPSSSETDSSAETIDPVTAVEAYRDQGVPADAETIKAVNVLLLNMSPEQRVGALSIKTGLPTQELAKDFMFNMEMWNNFGSCDELRDASIAANKSWDDYLPGIEDEGADAMTGAMLVPGWKNIPSLATMVDNYKGFNDGCVGDFITKWKNKDKEGFMFFLNTASVSESPSQSTNPNERIVTIKMVANNNGQSGTGESHISNQRSGIESTLTVTFDESGTSSRVKDFSQVVTKVPN